MARGGRPRVELNLKEVRKLRAKGLSYRQIARTVIGRAGKRLGHPSFTTIWRRLSAGGGEEPSRPSPTETPDLPPSEGLGDA